MKCLNRSDIYCNQVKSIQNLNYDLLDKINKETRTRNSDYHCADWFERIDVPIIIAFALLVEHMQDRNAAEKLQIAVENYYNFLINQRERNL
jgi:hypothetical protein